MSTIWDEEFCKLRVSVYILVTSKELLSESSNRIDTNLDVVVVVLKVNRSVSVELFLDEFI